MESVQQTTRPLTETERRSAEIERINAGLEPFAFYDDTNGDHTFDESGAWFTLREGAPTGTPMKTVPDDPDNS